MKPKLGEREKIYNFRKGFSKKANVISRVEFEHVSYDVAEHQVNHYATEAILHALYRNYYALITTLSAVATEYANCTSAPTRPV